MQIHLSFFSVWPNSCQPFDLTQEWFLSIDHDLAAGTD